MTPIAVGLTNRVAHVHRAATGLIGGCAVFACPGSYVQLALDLTEDASQLLVREPPGCGPHECGPPFRLS